MILFIIAGSLVFSQALATGATQGLLQAVTTLISLGYKWSSACGWSCCFWVLS